MQGSTAPSECVSRPKTAKSSSHCCCLQSHIAIGQERPRSTNTPNHKEHILQAVTDNPGISTHQVALACCRFHSTAWTVIQEKLLCLYYLQCVQGLLPSDHSPRENFCQWFIAQTAEPLFVSSVLFTNEATFRKRDEITNLQNQHLWANQNPHGTIQASHCIWILRDGRTLLEVGTMQRAGVRREEKLGLISKSMLYKGLLFC